MIYIAEYIWTDINDNFRSKSKTIIIQNIDNFDIENIKLYEDWSYDGSSTGEASGNFSEILLKPVSVFLDPFRGDSNVLVLCDTYDPKTNEPMKTCHRPLAKALFDKNTEMNPWYGLEQEFFIMQQLENPSIISNCPIGFNKNNLSPNSQGQYYCSIGSNNAFGREIVEKAYQLCLKAELNISGMNAEVAPGQWELQVGPCTGIQAGDDLQITRYILHRVGELYNVQINYEPKPFIVNGDWNGSGCHVNFSTKQMREGTSDKTGLEYIEEAIKKLETKHDEHMKYYGKGNEYRMSGMCETSSYNSFSWGVANRGASIRIPQNTKINKKGYFEDRRPAANINPYLVIGKIFETIST